jgi:transcription antitermination factor NusG
MGPSVERGANSDLEMVHSARSPQPDPLPWYALRIQSRLATVASLTLRDRGFEEFFPLYHTRRRWSDRFKELDLPLFPGYLFCRFGAGDRLPIVTTPGVIGIVGFGGTPVPIDPSEIAAIHRVLQSGIAAEPWKYIESGRRVRVEHGALAGLEGIFIEMKKDRRLLLSVTMLQRSVAVQIDEACVVPIMSAFGVVSPAAILAAR